jgi:radical SAM-linked protein
MIIRVKYTKTDILKYLSHLDMVRLMERAFRRAEIDLHYTQGFHPIAKMSFSPPVALGIESYGELLEADLNCSSFDSNDFIDKLNTSLPIGCRILDAVKIDKEEGRMSKRRLKADYEILFDNLACDEIVISIQKAMDNDSCIITKINKSGKKVQTDIRNKIFYLDAYENSDQKAIMRCVLDSTQNSILSPVSLLNYLKENCYLQIDENYKITKTDMVIS